MLKIAYYYIGKLQSEYSKIINNQQYKYYNNSEYWNYNFELSDKGSNWGAIEYVSVDNDDNVIGFLGANLDRSINNVTCLRILNFKDKANIIFSKDLMTFLKELFTVHNFRKINFSIVVGNPIEKMYDKYCLKYGGRIVGVFKDHTVLTDGKYHDTKYYEIFNEDFKKHINK